MIHRFDVVVVGSGAGGGACAHALVQAGLDVCLLEEGQRVPRQDQTTRPSEMVSKLYRGAGATTILGRPNIQYVEGRTVGGSTLINGGMCWRTPEGVLQRWVERLADPSLAPEAMTPLFEEVERENGVALQDPESLGLDNLAFRDAALALGWSLRENRRNQRHCAGTNHCILGCPTGAKQSTLESYIPRFEAAGGTLLASTRALSLQRFGGKVGGVFVTAAEGGRRSLIEARAVVLCAGSTYTPMLLWNSGLQNPHLGRHLHLHPTLKTIGLYDRPMVMWKGVHQSHQVTEFIEKEGNLLASGSVPPSILAMGVPGFGREHAELMAQYDKMLVIGAMVEDTTTGRIRRLFGHPIPTYFLTQLDLVRIKRALDLTLTMHRAAGARKVLLPLHHLPVVDLDEGPSLLAAHEIDPSEIELMTVHLMGTCRMGRDRHEGVVDSRGKVFGYGNLFVADASVFPTHLGVNPMETIWVLARRTANRILEHREEILGVGRSVPRRSSTSDKKKH